MKEKLKNVTFLRKIVFFIRKEFFIIDYLKDFFFYKKNYMYAKNTKSSVGYNILFAFFHEFMIPDTSLLVM